MSDGKLAPYRSKRDFSKTAEPSDTSTVAPSNRLRYVIQKHAATRLHYDFRLELDGVFKSLGGDQGPVARSADKRLAVEVEDHPLDYGDFEGTIPKGQYGGGTVQLWDRGYWEPEDGYDPQRRSPRANLKFRWTARGCMAAGCWSGCKNDHSRSKRTNWLLIKHRDEGARRRGMAMTFWPRIVRSLPAARWRRSLPARAGEQNRSCLAAGQGRADAVWQVKETQRSAAGQGSSERPDARISCSHNSAARSSGRRAETAGCMRSSSMAIACNCGSRRPRHAAHPQRARLERQVSGDRRGSAEAARCAARRRGRRARRQRHSQFLRASGRAVGRQDRRPRLFRLRLAARRRRRSARRAARCPQGAPGQAAARQARRDRGCAMSSISRPTARRCWNPPAALGSKASSRSGSMRPIRRDAATPGPSRNAGRAMKW